MWLRLCFRLQARTLKKNGVTAPGRIATEFFRPKAAIRRHDRIISNVDIALILRRCCQSDMLSVLHRQLETKTSCDQKFTLVKTRPVYCNCRTLPSVDYLLGLNHGSN